MNPQRMRILRDGKQQSGPVLYWMSRDQRATCNWALVYAQELALEMRVPLLVAFALSPGFLGATVRQYDFMLRGLEETGRTLAGLNIPFFLLEGAPGEELPLFMRRNRIGALVTDFSPLRIARKWKTDVGKEISVPFHEVDAHNIVPCWIASDKAEFSAATFRPKINRLLPTFLEEMKTARVHPVSWKRTQDVDWKRISSRLTLDQSVSPVEWLRPGENAGAKVLRDFIRQRLEIYGTMRNDPTVAAQSDLSPFLHFGQIGAQYVVRELLKSKKHAAAREAFLEEFIVRRELSDNFCNYTQNYDQVDAFPRWAKASLSLHEGDRRQYLYSRSMFERAETHDPLWNAAQRELALTGKMHGYLRMYWAKKILEWSASPRDAMRTAIYLNDRYQLDGRDPNGYAGIAWSIGGVHDRAWGEREVFGKIRYMSFDGCKRKFDVGQYIAGVQERTKG